MSQVRHDGGASLSNSLLAQAPPPLKETGAHAYPDACFADSFFSGTRLGCSHQLSRQSSSSSSPSWLSQSPLAMQTTPMLGTKSTGFPHLYQTWTDHPLPHNKISFVGAAFLADCASHLDAQATFSFFAPSRQSFSPDGRPRDRSGKGLRLSDRGPGSRQQTAAWCVGHSAALETLACQSHCVSFKSMIVAMLERRS